MSDEESDFEKVRAEYEEQTDPGTRSDATPKQKQEFKDDLVEALHSRQGEGSQRTVSVWDADMAAFVDALEEHEDVMDDLGTSLQERLGRDRDAEEIDRSEVLRLLLRVGLNEGKKELAEALVDAKAESARSL